MVKLYPRGQEGSPLCTFFFLHCLPWQLRVLLTDKDHTDRRALVVKADQPWAHNTQHAHDLVATGAKGEDEECAAVAIVRQQKSGGRLANRPTKKAGYRSLSAADKKAVADSDMSYYQWAFADNARICHKPCSWSEN
jgi:hypothetical protein